MELLTILKRIKVDTLSYKTISVNKANAQKEWVVVDTSGLRVINLINLAN